MNDIASALQWHGANTPVAVAMLCGAHLAAQDLPASWSWEIGIEPNGRVCLKILLARSSRTPAEDMETWARYLGREVHVGQAGLPGFVRLSIETRYMGTQIEVWTTMRRPAEAAPEPPAAAPPAAPSAPTTPDPAEALGQAPVTYPFGEPSEPTPVEMLFGQLGETRQDGAAPAPEPPPTGMYGSLR